MHDYKKLAQDPEFVEAMEDVRLGRNLHGPFRNAQDAIKALLEEN